MNSIVQRQLGAGQLAGKTAIVTGAARGLAAAVTDLFAAEGADLVLVDLDPIGLESSAARARAAGATVRTEVVDLTDEQAVHSLMDRVAAELGGIDVLVNAAGIVSSHPFLELSVEEWDRMITVDLRSVFLCCRFATPHMVARGSGRIINFASQIGIKGGELLAHYASAKAGVIGLTRSLGIELAPHGVLVNAIAPGPIDTESVLEVDAEWRERKRASLPLGRFGRPEEVAPTVLLLAAEPSGNIYVGQVLGPNSGDVMP